MFLGAQSFIYRLLNANLPLTYPLNYRLRTDVTFNVSTDYCFTVLLFH